MQSQLTTFYHDRKQLIVCKMFHLLLLLPDLTFLKLGKQKAENTSSSRCYKSFIDFDNLILLTLWGVKMWQKVQPERPRHALRCTRGKACNWHQKIPADKSWRIKVDGMCHGMFCLGEKASRNTHENNFWKNSITLGTENVFAFYCTIKFIVLILVEDKISDFPLF